MEARIFRREADQAVIQGGDLPAVAAADLAEEDNIHLQPGGCSPENSHEEVYFIFRTRRCATNAPSP